VVSKVTKMAFRVILLICIVAVVSGTSNNNLKAVVQIFRHGQRTPTSFYPSDPYGNLTTYFGGLNFGQLTNEGKRQHYALGQFTRRRYSDWLPTTYSDNDIYVQTTDVDRTHMSAQANLFGLYPAKGTQVWNRGTTWQPIPIHPSDPRIVYTGVSSCSALNRLLPNVINEEEFVTLDTTYASMYAYLSSHTGSNITSFFGAASVYDTLIIEDNLGFPLPSWTSAVYPEPLATITARAFSMFSYTTQLKRFLTGVFLNNVLEHFEGITAGTSSSAKYQMYSAHDTNVFAILDSVGNTRTKPVVFATSLWFELRTVNFVDVVNLWMRSGTDFTQLSIAGCALDCPLSTVRTLLSDILLDLDTFDAECAS